ncbi:MAG: hypothetical protein QM773_02860 [Hyphomonadaceae bacterium]
MGNRGLAWLVVAHLLLAACATSASSIQVLSVRDLNAGAASFDGKAVRVRGYLLLGTNGRSLYQSEARFAEWKKDLFGPNPTNFDAYANDCITLMNVDAFFDHVELLGERAVSVEGTFVKDFFGPDVVDGQRCMSRPSALIATDTSVKAVIRQAR